jgi:hypothetical protein
MKAHLEALDMDREKLRQELEEVKSERNGLAEKVAHFEMTTEYEFRSNLPYRKDDGSGPYCPVDRFLMTPAGYHTGFNLMRCPKCKYEVHLRVQYPPLRRERLWPEVVA